MGDVLEAAAVRRWLRLAADALGRTRADIDALNVFPVPDGDTGTNLHLTVLAAAERLDALPGEAGPAAVWHAVAQGALLGARGNSGVILSQMLRGMADVLAVDGAPGGGARDRGRRTGAEDAHDAGEAHDAADGGEAQHAGGAEGTDGAAGTGRADAGGATDTGGVLGRALRRAADLAHGAVAHPVDGTMLSVLHEAAHACPAGDLRAAARAVAERARTALGETPGHLDVLARNGVVDAGAAGLCVILDALAAVVTGEFPETYVVPHRSRAGFACDPGEGWTGGAYEVMYLLDADAGHVENLRAELDRLGDSLVVVGGEDLWNVHVHTDDAGAAVEAGLRAGRPHRIRVTHLRAGDGRAARPPGRGAPARGVVAIVAGDGQAALFAGHGARVVRRAPGEAPGLTELAEAIRSAGDEVAVLPDDEAALAVAQAAARRAEGAGVRAAVVPARAPVQGLAALAVHDPLRRFEDDVIAMTRAAGATRFGRLEIATEEAVTSAGVCRPGDVLGLVDGGVSVIGTEPADVAARAIEAMLSAGSEMVTLIVGAGAPDGLPDAVRARLHEIRPDLELVVYDGGQSRDPLLIGVE